MCVAGAVVLVWMVAAGAAKGAPASGDGGPAASPGDEAAGVPGRGTLRPAGGDEETARQVEALTDEALAVAKRLVADFPEDPSALIAAGNAYHWLGRSREAAASWQRALEHVPNRPDVLFALSRLALKEGRLEDAETHARRALAVAGQVPGIRQTLAAALLLKGQGDEAVALLEEEVRLAPRSVETHYLLGRACWQTGQHRRAKAYYEHVLSRQPNHKNACYGLVRACLRLGETDQAKAYRERFGAIKRRDLDDLIEETTTFDDQAAVRRHLVGTLTEAGTVYRKRGRGPDAERLLRRAAELDPQAVACRRELAALYGTAGRYGQALRMYRQLAGLQPAEPAHLVGIGGIHLRQGGYGEAEQAFREARRAAPERAIGHRALAHFYLARNRNLERALELARWAVRLEPAAINYFVLSRALDVNGNQTEAERALRKACDLDPDNAVYRKAYERYRKNL
jgi:tetratricopeptide (TPR) repeat protein